MTRREIRCSEIPPEWEERLLRRACPVCGKERGDFDNRHRGYQLKDEVKNKTMRIEAINVELGRNDKDPNRWYGGTPCCCSKCTSEYWDAKKTWQQHRSQLLIERGFVCARCKADLHGYPEGHKLYDSACFAKPWVLDHIIPIALGGSMWDPANHQILCEKCNKEKTARDLGQIAAAKRLRGYRLPDINEAVERMRHTPVQSNLDNF